LHEPEMLEPKPPVDHDHSHIVINSP
jgi:hypothetical protein